MKKNPARWRAVDARLGREPNIWLATVRQDGRPHLAPVWFVWLDDLIYVATGSESQKFVNLRHNQKIALALPDANSVVLLEGEAHVANRATVDSVAEHFFNKYEWDFRYDESAEWRLLEITPLKILAWGDGYEGEGSRLL